MYKNVEVTGCGLKKHFMFSFLFVVWFHTVFFFFVGVLFHGRKNRKKRLLESHLYLLELFNGIFPLEKSLMATLYFFSYNHTYLIYGGYIYIKDQHS